MPRGFRSRRGPVVIAAQGAGARRERSQQPWKAGRRTGRRQVVVGWRVTHRPLAGRWVREQRSLSPSPRPSGGLMKGTPSEPSQCPPAARVEGPEQEASREEEETRPPGCLTEGLCAHLRAQNVHLHPRVQLLQTKNLILSCDPCFGLIF